MDDNIKISKTSCFIAALLTIAVVEMGTDIYVPSLTSIADYFKVPITMVNLTISLNLLGLGVSSLFYGPLSDYRGRKFALALGGIIFLIGSLGACFSYNIYVLYFWRFVQGFGGGAALPVGQAVIKDIYQGSKVAIMLSRAGMIIALSPLLGPVIGSYIAHFYDWHLSFFCTFFASIVALVTILLFIPTSLPNRKIKSGNYFIAYFKLLSNLKFIKYSAIQLLILLWLWADTSVMPFILIKNHQVQKADYGFYVLFSVLIYILGTIFNQVLLRSIKVETVLCAGLLLMLIGAINMILSQLFMNLTPFLIILSKIPASLGLGLILGNVTAKAMDQVPKNNLGYAASLISCLQMICGSLGAILLGYSYDGTILPSAILLSLCTVCSLYSLYTTAQY